MPGLSSDANQWAYYLRVSSQRNQILNNRAKSELVHFPNTQF